MIKSQQPTATRNYAAIPSLPLTTKASSKGISTVRNEISLYRSFNSANETTQSTYSIHRTGIIDHSVFFTFPHCLKNLKIPFSIALSEKFPFGVGLGFTIHEDIQDTVVKVTLISAEHCKEAVATSLVVENQVFTASPAVHPGHALLRLRDKLLNNFARYSVVGELAAYLDDWAQRWLSGNGRIYLERPPSSEIKFDPLTYKISLGGDYSCLGHIRKDCPSLPIETRTCFVCHGRGHITASKRCRPIPVDSNYEALVTVLSHPVETLSSTTPPASFVPVLHEVPATYEEVTSAPASKHPTAAQISSADSSVNLVFVPTSIPCTPSDHYQSAAAGHPLQCYTPNILQTLSSANPGLRKLLISDIIVHDPQTTSLRLRTANEYPRFRRLYHLTPLCRPNVSRVSDFGPLIRYQSYRKYLLSQRSLERK
ncbi:hypothetical protein CU097_002722 [Rhizopus azygosporus]|uniref:Uncharacterized protein n=1 Tax=Rhizopus azygosporus TaxID=86630 RepID=A0A367JH99_RHIAZ|nr:hypothetical protein CU097_002722 [Rhizopus azygosporus]